MVHLRLIVAYLITFAMVLATQGIAIGQVVALGPVSKGDDSANAPIQYGVWVKADDPDSEKSMRVMRLKVHPQAAPIPALKHRLIPDPDDRTDGNAAMFYLKAMGFIEQYNAREQLHKMQQKWYQDSRDSEEITGDFAPNIWFDMPPSELPLDQVKSYLELIAFQSPLLYDAARRKNYSQDRSMEKVDNPIAYLLPEVQQMRELARQQIVRLRYAVAQHRIDDAVEILGQMVTMANHLGRDEFLVSSLVAVAVESLAVEQGLMLTEQSDAPNLYWAIAALPDPLIDLSAAIESERNLLSRQFPALKKVDETVRTDAYWAAFVEEIIPQWNRYAELTNGWSGVSHLPNNIDKFQMAGNIATQYEPARRFLSEVSALQDEQLDQFSTTQTVFLALVNYQTIAMDEETVAFYLPYWSQQRAEVSAIRERWRGELGWVAGVSDLLLFGSETVRSAFTRIDQLLSLWQTVEAVRLTVAGNDAVLPSSLSDLTVPAPLDPVCNRPFSYVVNGQTATITGKRIGGSRYQLIIEMVKSKTEETK